MSVYRCSVPPIFIVGVPRSGTTLLAALISATGEVSCGPETHFFLLTSGKERTRAVADPSWPKEAVQILTSLKKLSGNVSRHFGLSDEDIERFLISRNPSQRAMLESLTVQYARKRGGFRWAEKTPDHLGELEYIRKMYPFAKIVHIVRDPRDVARSLTKVSWGSDSIVANAYRWHISIEEASPFLERDNNVYTIRYEDLLSEPIREMRNLCRFLGTHFEEGVPDPSAAARDVTRDAEYWKEKVHEPIDPTRAFNWKRTLDDETARTIGLICSDGIKRYGYSDSTDATKTFAVYVADRQKLNRSENDHRKFAPYESKIRHLAMQGVRLAPDDAPFCPTKQIGRPILFLWTPQMGRSRLERFISLGYFLLFVVRERKNIYYMSDVKRRVQGFTAKVGVWALNTFGKNVGWDEITDIKYLSRPK